VLRPRRSNSWTWEASSSGPSPNRSPCFSHQQVGAERLPFDDCEEDRPLFGLDDSQQALDQRVRRGLDEDIDLAPTWKTDRERELVRDPVREELRARSFEYLARVVVDVALDTAS